MQPPIIGLAKIREINFALNAPQIDISAWRGRTVELKQIEEALRAVIATREEDIPFLRRELETLKGHVQKLPDDTRKSDCLKKISDLSNRISGRDNALEEPSPADSLELRNIVALPPETLEHIFSFIPENERAVLKEVCWSFRKSRPVAESKLTKKNYPCRSTRRPPQTAPMGAAESTGHSEGFSGEKTMCSGSKRRPPENSAMGTGKRMAMG